MQPVEIFFISLLVVVTVTIGWFSAFVVYRLYKGQR